jgi:glycosyltransferase involved in cell wall biosynthesis
VVVPARDPGPYLRLALDSVVAQTHPRWEAIVVDDASSQDLSWVTGIDPRVRLIRQEPLGLGPTRNTGIAATTAPLVAFLDSDDLWAPEKLERQIAAMRAHPDVAMSDTSFRRIDADGADIGEGYSGHHRNYYELLEGCGICVSTVMVRREVLTEVGGFSPMHMVEDWDLYLRISRTHSVDLRVPEALGRYRVHQGGLSQRYLAIFVVATGILWEHRRQALQDGDLAGVRAADAGIAGLRRRASRQALDAARRHWAGGRPGPTAGHLAVATVMAPKYMVGKARQQVEQRVNISDANV